jgi:L-ascorbate metabolism protein UlaG (beta-lactamase superfamily)
MTDPAREIDQLAAPELTWLGTAGFRVRNGDKAFLIDPYLSRNRRARPIQGLGPKDISQGGQIFISHGHFDHILDVPGIATRLGAKVFCHSTQARSLVRDGLGPGLVVEVEGDGQLFEFGSFSARADFSRHIKFDLPLIIKTLLRINIRLPALLPLTREYPPGQVLSWRFQFPGISIRHFGSAGYTQEELENLAQERTDMIMIPLQGHSRICDIALEHVRILRPKKVIAHHQDDFFPPISQEVDIEPFLRGMSSEFPEIEMIVPKLNEPIPLRI